MYKKIIILSVIPAIIGIFFLFYQNETILSEPLDFTEPDIIMPTKSSRPGCEVKDLCYIPSITSIKVDSSITWQNQDSAFHSVTSGIYGKPDGLFDSGHLDPNQYFTVNFKEIGEYDYFCSLHPWMKGKIVVESKI